MPRVSKVQAKKGLPEDTFVLDNGAYTLKAGFADLVDASSPTSSADTLSKCSVIPNCIVRTRDRKTYVGAQCDDILQWSEAIWRRPLENGQLVGWEAQKEIWDRSLFNQNTADQNVYVKTPGDTTLVFTEAPNTMPSLQKNADEIIMEEWGFGAYLRVVGPSLNAYNDTHPLFESEAALKAKPEIRHQPMECILVVDSGYSHTVITPVYEGRPIQRGIRRIEFGGKHLTNLLKEVVSVRHFDLHQDTKIVNDIKENIAFVSQDFAADMEKTWKGNKSLLKSLSRRDEDSMEIDGDTHSQDIRVDYVLPDGVRILKGFSRSHDPSAAIAKRKKLSTTTLEASEISMTLGNERFAVPEILFNPADIGSKQPGLVDGIMQSLSVLPPLIQATMLANTLIVGGNANIPGFLERLQDELRSNVSTDWLVRVRKMDDPVKSTWLGGVNLATKYRPVLEEHAVTRDEYLEHGSGLMARKFTHGSKMVP